MAGSPAAVTTLLQAWKAGDPTAPDRLVPLVYDELKKLAAGCMRGEHGIQTLQPTALVHEAYLRLTGSSDHDFRNGAHFRCVAARVMRQILVDRARARRAEKRNAGWRVEFDADAAVAHQRAPGLVALDGALADLEKLDAGKARILELKYFGGLSADEMAEVLGLTVNQVNWQIRTAQAWLKRELTASANATQKDVAESA
jgi:RNA polymerase sigma-70 factor, ECF subfamily